MDSSVIYSEPVLENVKKNMQISYPRHTSGGFEVRVSSSSRLVALPRVKGSICPIIYL